MISKNMLTYLSVFTLFGFSALAYFILSFSESFSYDQIFTSSKPLLDIVFGLIGGSILAGIGWLILQLPMLKTVGDFFKIIFNQLTLTTPDILFYSFCAGVGEEILFRGAIQPFLGIWVTAILFVLLHGYISLKDKPKSLYGLYLILVAASFGYAYEYGSIYMAMSAHFMYDLVMFSYLKQKIKSSKN